MNTTLRVHTLTHLMSREAGGLYVSVRRLAQQIAAQGVHVDVAGLWDTHFDTDATSWLPLHPTAFKPRGPANLGLSPALHRHLSDLTDDGSIIHLQGLWKLTSYATLCASRAASAPTIISPRGMLDTWALAQSATQAPGWHTLREPQSTECGMYSCSMRSRASPDSSIWAAKPG